jgi:hypothetical protein
VARAATIETQRNGWQFRAKAVEEILRDSKEQAMDHGAFRKSKGIEQ